MDDREALSLLDTREAELKALSNISAQSREPVALDQQSVGRLSRMDAMQQQAMSRATEETRKRDLLRIEAARRRLRDGEFGYCEDCGDTIAPARLDLDLTAPKCMECARAG